MKMTALKWTNTGFFLAMVLINALANLIPIGIGATGAVSAKYPNLFTPAPVTFSIWGVIYVMMAAFVLYQWGLFDHGTYSGEILKAVGPFFAISCALNIAWIFTWHFDAIGLSLICIAGLLVSLIILNLRLDTVKGNTLSFFMADAGFQIYLGWIIAAVIANVSVFLVSIGWNRFGLSETLWTFIILIVGALIGAAPAIFGGKWLTTLAVLWAYSGILIRHVGMKGLAGQYPLPIAAAITGVAVMLVAISWSALDEVKPRTALPQKPAAAQTEVKTD